MRAENPNKNMDGGNVLVHSTNSTTFVINIDTEALLTGEVFLQLRRAVRDFNYKLCCRF